MIFITLGDEPIDLSPESKVQRTTTEPTHRPAHAHDAPGPARLDPCSRAPRIPSGDDESKSSTVRLMTHSSSLWSPQDKLSPSSLFGVPTSLSHARYYSHLDQRKRTNDLIREKPFGPYRGTHAEIFKVTKSSSNKLLNIYSNYFIIHPFLFYVSYLTFSVI
jgi:hypothetical protein